MDLLTEFKQATDEAQLSMDEEKLRAVVRKYNGSELPTDPLVFWGSVHKARTGNLRLPKDVRQESKNWLTKHGLTSHDDGDLD